MQTSLSRAWRLGASTIPTLRAPFSVGGLRTASDAPSGPAPSDQGDGFCLRLDKVPRSALRSDVLHMINHSADPSDIRIEYSPRYRPLAWWISFKTDQHRGRAIAALKDSPVVYQKAVTSSQMSRATQSRVNDLTASGASFVLAENVDYNATMEDCWKFLLGYDHLPRPVWMQRTREDNSSGEAARSILFAMRTAEEAYRLVREKGNSTLKGTAMHLRVLA